MPLKLKVRIYKKDEVDHYYILPDKTTIIFSGS